MYQSIYVDKRNGIYAIRDDEHGVITGEYTPYAYVPDPNGDCVTIYGDPVTRIDNPNNETDGLYEADIQPETRLLVDLYTDSDEPPKSNRIMTLDIEVEVTDSFPEPMDAANKITAIALHDSDTGHYTVYVLDEEQDIETHTKDNITTVSCVDERSLVGKFLDHYEQIKPTIITGWNIDGFDIPYLYNRIKRLFGKKETLRLSPFKNIYYHQYKERYMLAGVSCLDYIGIYKKHTFVRQPSYTLDYISLITIGRGKLDYSDKYSSLEALRKGDLDMYIQYNITDVELVVALEEKLKFIDLTVGVCHIAHVQYEDIYMDSRVIDGAILTYLKRNNLVAPNRPPREMMLGRAEEKKKFEGAYVKPPIPGMYHNIYDLDLTSLYPSILMGLNISPETKLFKIENWDEAEYLHNPDFEFEVMGKLVTCEKLKRFLEQENCNISSNGVVYNNAKRGIIPTILDDWFNKRVEYRKLETKADEAGDKDTYKFYNQRQLIQKVLLNSVYGVFGLSSFRYFDVDNAKSVTLSGQTVIKRTVQFANKIYTDETGGVIEVIADKKPFTYYVNEQVPTENRGVILGADLQINDVTPEGTLSAVKHISWQEFNARNSEVDDYFKHIHRGIYDFNIYIDTDSVFMSAEPIIRVRYPNWREFDDTTMTARVFDVADEVQRDINTGYDVLAKTFFNLDEHRFQIKQEMIAKTGLWTAKKRYAQHIVAKNGVPRDELDVKGIDIVRSSFPPRFKRFMTDLLTRMLKNETKDSLDKSIIEFRDSVKQMADNQDKLNFESIIEIAKVSTVNNMTKYKPPLEKMKDTMYFESRTPGHVRAAISYNRMMDIFGCAMKHPPVSDGDKIKVIYLRRNEYGIESIALKGDGTDPEQIVQFIVNNIDTFKMLKRELDNKLESLYSAMDWSMPTVESLHMNKFFAF